MRGRLSSPARTSTRRLGQRQPNRLETNLTPAAVRVTSESTITLFTRRRDSDILESAYTAAGATWSAPALAQQQAQVSTAEPDNTGEILVIARRRAERLIDVPVAASTRGGETLGRYATTDLSSVATQVPQLKIDRVRLGNGTIINIPGVGSSVVDAAIEQEVTVNIDGIPISRGRVVTQALFDDWELTLVGKNLGWQQNLRGRRQRQATRATGAGQRQYRPAARNIAPGDPALVGQTLSGFFVQTSMQSFYRASEGPAAQERFRVLIASGPSTITNSTSALAIKAHVEMPACLAAKAVQCCSSPRMRRVSLPALASTSTAA